MEHNSCVPPKRIHKFPIPRTTPTYGLKKWLFQAVYEVCKGTLWKLGKLGTLWKLGKFCNSWDFFGVESVAPVSTLKMRKILKKISTCMYTQTHTHIREYVMGGGKSAPPPRVNISFAWWLHGENQPKNSGQTETLGQKWISFLETSMRSNQKALKSNRMCPDTSYLSPAPPAVQVSKFPGWCKIILK